MNSRAAKAAVPNHCTRARSWLTPVGKVGEVLVQEGHDAGLQPRTLQAGQGVGDKSQMSAVRGHLEHHAASALCRIGHCLGRKEGIIAGMQDEGGLENMGDEARGACLRVIVGGALEAVQRCSDSVVVVMERAGACKLAP